MRIVFCLAMIASVAAVDRRSDAQDVRTRDVAAPSAKPPGTYAMGIMARNTAAGVEVVSVQPGSVALASGLRAGDVIINVAGYQVGYVGDHLYDLNDEIARRINAAHQVPLLVRRGGTGALEQVAARYATKTGSTVTGVLTAEAGRSIPPTALVTVRLLDVTEPQWKDVAITQGTLPASTGFPATYRLELPVLVPQHRYGIDARVEDAGRLLLQAPSPAPLPPDNRDHRIDLALSGRGVPGATGPAGPSPRDQIQQWIQAYLGRPPRPYEADIWMADLQRGRTLTDVQAGILSSTEMFERCRANRDVYVAEVFRVLYGAPPNASQLQDLQGRYDRVQGIRMDFAEQLLRRA